MKKIGLLKSEKMGEYERKQGYASYRTLVNYYIGDIVLCNNIASIDTSVYDNMDFDLIDEDGQEFDIFQYYLCNLNEWEKANAINCGLKLSYSDMLDCDVLCVDHFGTSWDYVLTDVKLFDTYEELKAWESSNDEE